MTALLLGGAGFIGLHLARRLLRDGHDVTIVDDFSRGRRDADLDVVSRDARVLDGDLTEPDTWAKLPHGWDEIYLLAAVVGVRNVERDPARAVRVNSLPALYLADWVVPGEKVFFADDRGRIAEDRHVPVMVSDVTAPRFAYAIGKLTGEAMLVHSARARGLAAVVGRFHNVYGPRMGADHVIPEMSLRALRGEDPFLVFGADQYRAFCYVDDAVEAMVRLMRTAAAAGQIVHIGDDTATTRIGDLAALVCRLAGVPPAFQTLPAPPGAVGRRCPDLDKLRRLTGYLPSVPLEAGVRRTLEWYQRFARTGPDATRSARVRRSAR